MFDKTNQQQGSGYSPSKYRSFDPKANFKSKFKKTVGKFKKRFGKGKQDFNKGKSFSNFKKY